MKHRIEKLRAALEDTGLDAFFSLHGPHNEYLAGFTGSASALIVTPQEAVFFSDFRYTEQVANQVSGFEYEEITGHIETAVGERLDQLGINTAAFDPASLTVQQQNLLLEAYSGGLEAHAEVMINLRKIKEPEEIDKIRAASNLAEAALTELLPRLTEGITEQEFAGRLEYEFKRRGAQGASFDTITLFGAGSSLPHGMPSAKKLAAGDVVLIDCGCRKSGYCSDLTRTFAYGTIPGAWFEEIYQVTLQAQEAALAGVAPGKRCSDIDDIARRIITDAGFGEYFGHGLGHGVGLEVHEGPRLNKPSKDVLSPGMVITIEPGIYLPGKGGVRIEDLVVVTDEGCDVLTALPKSLEVLNT